MRTKGEGCITKVEEFVSNNGWPNGAAGASSFIIRFRLLPRLTLSNRSVVV